MQTIRALMRNLLMLALISLVGCAPFFYESEQDRQQRLAHRQKMEEEIFAFLAKEDPSGRIAAGYCAQESKSRACKEEFTCGYAGCGKYVHCETPCDDVFACMKSHGWTCSGPLPTGSSPGEVERCCLNWSR
jgi:hypothetical protein